MDTTEPRVQNSFTRIMRSADLGAEIGYRRRLGKH